PAPEPAKPAPEPAKPAAQPTTPAPKTPPTAATQPPPERSTPAEPAITEFRRPAKDAEALDADEERDAGALLHALILRNHKESGDGGLKGRCLAALERLLGARQRKEIGYQVTVLEDVDHDSINAFSHLGGYIYVSRGLANLVADDVELEFLIGR